MSDLTLSPAKLTQFADDLRSALGSLVLQCGIPVSSAMAAASTAIEWNDNAVNVFGARWDQEIAAISQALTTYMDGLVAAANAYVATDDELAGK